MSEPKVFITYRRQETAPHAGRLYDAMVARFGEDNVFMDVEMAPGVDFVERITEAVAGCHVLLVVMGPRWATVEDQRGRPRLADPGDYVRLEVETALRRPEVTPIPVLVSGARMPSGEDLPPGVRPITRRNALELSDMRWRQDVGRLISTLDELLAETPGPPSGERSEATGKAAPADAARAAAETAPPLAVAASRSVQSRPTAPPGRRGRRLRWALLGGLAIAAIVVAIVVAVGGGGSSSSAAPFIPADLGGLVLPGTSPPAQSLEYKGGQSGGGAQGRAALEGMDTGRLPSDLLAAHASHWSADVASVEPQSADSIAAVFEDDAGAEIFLERLKSDWHGSNFEPISAQGLGDAGFAFLLNGSSEPEYRYVWRTGNLLQLFDLFSSSTPTPVDEGTARNVADNMADLTG